MLSKETLLKQARENRYKPEILEKVIRLLDVLEAFVSVPYLKNRLVLKGGTALNIFHFKQLPRLSVDIDLNYIGSLDKETMLEERPIINEGIQKILTQKGFFASRNPGNYAGGKMVWRYESVLGQKGNLEIDLNYMYRQPLLDIEWKSPNLIDQHLLKIPVLDIHELAAGKLTALFARKASRDLFDSHHLLTAHMLSLETLRPIWVSYLAMSDIDLDHLFPEEITYDLTDVHNQLLPVLRQNNNLGNKRALESWIQEIIKELQFNLSSLLPLKDHENKFIKEIRDNGLIIPELITDDQILIEKIKNHPALLWAIHKKK